MHDEKFDHYQLNVSVYDGKLAAYALGRLLTRLAWHHEQWLVLLAESGCKHFFIPDTLKVGNDANQRGSQKGSREPTAQRIAKGRRPKTKSIKVARDEVRKQNEAIIEVEDAIRRLNEAITQEACQQRSLGCAVFGQLAGIIQRLPTSASAELLGKLESFRLGLFESPDEHFEAAADKLEDDIRARRDDPESVRWRREGLRTLLRPYLRYFNKFRKAATQIMVDDLREYFYLGQGVEQLLCPSQVFRHMTLESPRLVCRGSLPSDSDGGESVANSCGFLLGYRSFAPGALKLTPPVVSDFEKSLDALAFENDFSDAIRSSTKPVAVAPIREIAEIEIDNSPNEGPPVDVPVLNDAFICRLRDNPDLELLVQKIHAKIIRGQRIPKSKQSSAPRTETIGGAFDEKLVVTGKTGALSREGYADVEINGETSLALLLALINGKGGTVDVHKQVGDSCKEAIYQLIRRIKPKLAEVGLTAKAVRTEGYRLERLSTESEDEP